MIAQWVERIAGAIDQWLARKEERIKAALRAKVSMTRQQAEVWANRSGSDYHDTLARVESSPFINGRFIVSVSVQEAERLIAMFGEEILVDGERS